MRGFGLFFRRSLDISRNTETAKACQTADDKETQTEKIGKISTVDVKSAETSELKVYKWRWYILLVSSIINFSGAVQWVAYITIANHADEYYCTVAGCRAANWFYMIFMVTTIPAMLMAMAANDTFGLRFALVVGSWIDFLGSGTRAFSVLPFLPHASRFPIALAGQFITSLAIPLSVSLPAKTAALWFPPHERTFATTVSIMAFQTGSAVAQFCSPLLVRKAADVPLLVRATVIGKSVHPRVQNIFISSVSLLGLVLATAGVRSSTPPSPPSVAAERKPTSFLAGVKHVARIPSYVIFCILGGTNIGALNGIGALLQQVLCPYGYSNTFVGATLLCGFAVLQTGSFGFASLSGRIRRRGTFVKICQTVASVATLAVPLLFVRAGAHVPIILLFCIINFFGGGILSISVDIAADMAYPAGESTSSGFYMIGIQLSGIIWLNLLQYTAIETSAESRPLQQCVKASAPGESFVLVYDWLSIFGWLFLHPKFRRTEHEESVKKERETGNDGFTNAAFESRHEEIEPRQVAPADVDVKL